MWRLRAPLLALLLMQVILLASSGVTATKKPLGKQETCNMKNHMIEYLRNNGVQIYERPQNLSPFCSHEWKKFGTCCEPKGIQQSVAQKVESNNFGLSQVVQEMSSAVLKLTQFRSKYLDTPLAAHLQHTKHSGNGITFSTAKSPEAEEDFKQDQGQLDWMNRTLHEKLQSRISLQKECVAELNSVISKSACSICSGRSDDFFSEDDRLLVSEPTCRAVLVKCNDAWIDMVSFVKDVGYYAYLVRKLILHYGFEIKDESVEEKAFTMNLDSFITNRNLIPIMEKCKKESLAVCSFEHVAALCEQFIHIQAPTYIESSQSQSELVISRLNRIRNLAVSNFTAAEEQLKVLETSEKSQATFPTRTKYLLKQVITLYGLNGNLRSIRELWIELKLEAPLLRNLLPKATGAFVSQMKDCSDKIEELLTNLIPRWVKLLLGKHKYLFNFLAELHRDKDKNYDANSRNQAAKLLWDKLNTAVELIYHPSQDPSSVLGAGLGTYEDFAVVLRGMYKSNLHRYFNAQVIQQVLYAHAPRDSAPTHAAYQKLVELGAVSPTDKRSLTILLGSAAKGEAGIHDFIAETMVVKSCQACIEIGEGIEGIPLTFEGP